MKLNTRLFGEIEYEEVDVIHFPQGIPSFEDEKSFLILPIEGSHETLLCLQSAATPALSFVMMNPFSLAPHYAPELREGERQLLGVEKDTDLCFYVLCAMKRPISSSTVNMKCPVALNPDNRIACQVILETDRYHMRHPLSEFSSSEEDASC